MNNSKLILGTNHKMYKTASQTVKYLRDLSDRIKDMSEDEIQLFVIPSYTSIPDASRVGMPRCFRLGAQNMHWEDKGENTGEISPLMLKEFGISIIELGHSERRNKFMEKDEQINKKVRAAVAHSFTALLCIGETTDDKENNISDESLIVQLRVGLKNIAREQVKSIWVAYEPSWAIGTQGKPAQPDYVDKRHRVIKRTLKEMFGKEGESIPVLFGGSVNMANAAGYIALQHVDGLFVGRAAWEADIFDELIRMVLSVWRKKQKQDII